LAIFEDFCKEQKTMEWTEKAICEIERAQNLQIYTNFYASCRHCAKPLVMGSQFYFKHSNL
jgi:hypothetical protein